MVYLHIFLFLIIIIWHNLGVPVIASTPSNYFWMVPNFIAYF